MSTEPTIRPLYRIDLAAPHQVYKNAAKKRVPGMTTVLGVFDKAALRPWACGMERDGVIEAFRAAFAECDTAFTFDGLLNAAREHFPGLDEKGNPKWFADTFTRKAADLGTVTHARCEAFLKGMELDESNLDPVLVERSQNGAIRFMDWWTMQGFTLVHSELQMVSEPWQIGGTADVIARRRNGAVALVDLKTSKASRYWPYAETFGQVAGYAAMYEHVTDEPVSEVHVVRIGKEEDDPGQTHTLTESEREAGIELVSAARVAYRAKQALGR